MEYLCADSDASKPAQCNLVSPCTRIEARPFATRIIEDIDKRRSDDCLRFQHRFFAAASSRCRKNPVTMPGTFVRL